MAASLPPRRHGGGRRAREAFETLALVVRRVRVGDADLLVTMLTRDRGLITASARAALRPSSKLGALEPMHTLFVGLELAPAEEIARLRSARIERPRLALLDDERRIHSASELLRQARGIIGVGAHEPTSFDALERGLDAIAVAPAGDESVQLARAGAQLLESLGYGLELACCVRCGTECPPGAAALVDPAKGGLVCRACGGGPLVLGGQQRPRVAAWLAGHELDLTSDEQLLAIRIVELAMRGHATQKTPAR